MNDYLAQWIAEAPVLAASAAVVLLMVGIAALLGFRTSAVLDQAELERLAANDGATVEAAVFAPNARQALARLSGGRVMIARVMGNDVSARIAPSAALIADLKRGELNARFADLGFPPLHMPLQAPAPPWLAELVGDAA